MTDCLFSLQLGRVVSSYSHMLLASRLARFCGRVPCTEYKLANTNRIQYYGMEMTPEVSQIDLTGEQSCHT